MKSTVVKRSVVLAGHKTSVSLEDAFWKGLKEIARADDRTLSAIVGELATRRHGNLSSAIRVFVLDYYRAQIAPAQAAAQLPTKFTDFGMGITGVTAE